MFLFFVENDYTYLSYVERKVRGIQQVVLESPVPERILRREGKRKKIKRILRKEGKIKNNQKNITKRRKKKEK